MLPVVKFTAFFLNYLFILYSNGFIFLLRNNLIIQIKAKTILVLNIVLKKAGFQCSFMISIEDLIKCKPLNDDIKRWNEVSNYVSDDIGLLNHNDTNYYCLYVYNRWSMLN